mgnify:CR=1 FL=1
MDAKQSAEIEWRLLAVLTNAECAVQGGADCESPTTRQARSLRHWGDVVSLVRALVPLLDAKSQKTFEGV